MRLFTSVNSSMHRQRRPLNELLATPWMVADMGSNTTVDPFCIYQHSGRSHYQFITYRGGPSHSFSQSLLHRWNKRKLWVGHCRSVSLLPTTLAPVASEFELRPSEPAVGMRQSLGWDGKSVGSEAYCSAVAWTARDIEALLAAGNSR